MRLSIIIIAFACSPCLPQDAGKGANASPNPRDVGSHYESAMAHRELATKYLQEGADQSLPARLTEAQVEFDRAASEYIAYASIGSNDGENNRIILAISGLLMSYHAPEALKLILEHPGTHGEPQVQRIKAEVLLALGLGKEAGFAYERWIREGKCMGRFYRNWRGEPRFGDGSVAIMPKGISDSCASLAPDLRVRLETLHRFFGHPNNLPKKNYPPSPMDTY